MLSDERIENLVVAVLLLLIGVLLAVLVPWKVILGVGLVYAFVCLCDLAS